MRQTVVVLSTFVLLLIGSVGAQEKVPVDKIPKAVMDALMSRFAKCKVDKCTKAKEGDAIVYDIEFTQASGKKGEADIKENGTWINFEKEIAEKDLPKVVRAAIDAKYPKATLKICMEETEVNGKDEKLSAYEVTLVTAQSKEIEVRVSPAGKILEDTSAEKKEEKKK